MSSEVPSAFFPGPEAFFLPADKRSMCLLSKRDVEATAGFQSPQEALRAALLFSYLKDLYSKRGRDLRESYDQFVHKMVEFLIYTVLIIITYLMTSGVGATWMTSACAWGLCLMCFFFAHALFTSNVALSVTNDTEKRRRWSKELLHKALFAFRVFDNRDLQARDDQSGDQAMKRACDSYRANCQQMMGDLDALHDFAPQYSESTMNVANYWSSAGYWSRNKWFPRCPADEWIRQIKGSDLSSIGNKFADRMDDDMRKEIRMLSNDSPDHLFHHLKAAVTKLGLHDSSC